MKKRGLNNILVIFLILLMINIVSSGTCSIKPSDDCAEYQRVIGIEGGHGGIYNESGYDNYLCCEDFLSPNRLKLENTNNLLFNLSDITNAHAGLNTQTEYDIPVYYGYLDCVSQQTTCPVEYPEEIASLSSITNAHIGEATLYDYDYKICCKEIMNPVVTWIYDDKTPIPDKTTIEVIPGAEGIGILATNITNLNEGEKVYFQIYKYQLIGDDIFINEIGGVVDSNNEVETYWWADASITKGDYYVRILNGPESGKVDLKVSTTTQGIFCSNETIVSCSSYESKGVCESDFCGVKETGLESVEGDSNFCSQTWEKDGCELSRSCSCYWNSSESKCVSKAEINKGIGCGDEIPDNIGTCIYEEESQDDCEDGFLSYSWKELWNWGSDNTGETGKSLAEGWINPGSSTFWYYDPFNLSLECSGEGNNVLPCPAAVKVPFSSEVGLIIAVIIIFVVYYLSSKKIKKKKKSSKK